jgi:DHA1 family tetracycline resistance protein-like MFS transporter
VAVVVDMLGYGIIIPLLPIAIARLGGGATLVGLLLAGYALIQAICGPLLGALSDRVGRRPVLLACLLGTATGYLLLGLADSLALLVLALVLDAATGANLSTAHAYVADRATEETRARDFGLLGVAFGLGVTAGPLMGGVLSRYGPGAPAFAAAGLALANFLAALVALPESLPSEHRAGRPMALLRPPQMWRAFADVWGMLGRVLATITLVNLTFAGLQSNFPIYSAARFGWGASTTATFFAFVGLCAVLTQGFLVGLLRRWLPELRLVQGGLVGLMLGLGWLAGATEPWMLYPAAAAAAVGSSICIPGLTSVLAARAGPSGQGRVMGAQQLAINLALVGGPLAAGLAFDRVAMSAPYALGAGCALVALVVLGRGRADDGR